MKVGDVVTLTFKNESPILTGPLAHLCPPTYEITGKVAVKPHWLTDPDRFALVVPHSPVPLRVIDRRSVLAVNGASLEAAREVSDVDTYEVPGSKPGSKYTVTRDGKSWSCTCVGFGFRKDCKHIHQAKERHAHH
mgnify:CR=1 FL=1